MEGWISALQVHARFPRKQPRWDRSENGRKPGQTASGLYASSLPPLYTPHILPAPHYSCHAALLDA